MPTQADTIDTGPMNFHRKLHRSGDSVVLTIPPRVLEATGWGVDDVIEISVALDRGAIVLEIPDEQSDE